MKGNKYNIILMRDDTSVKRYRLSSLWLKLTIFLFLFLIASSLTGGYLAYVFFDEKNELANKYKQDLILLEETERKLKRLQNIEKILASYNEEELRYFLTGRQDRQTEVVPSVDLDDIFGLVDSSVVSISNVQASFVRDRMRVQLEVNNMVSDQTVTGRVYLFLVRRDGMTVDLNLQDTELDFAIARFKRMDTSFELPEVMDQDSVFALRIKANDDDGNTIYSETFPLSHILI